jgi:hypothetical protein
MAPAEPLWQIGLAHQIMVTFAGRATTQKSVLVGSGRSEKDSRPMSELG